jgi:hypothetical protein
MSQSGGNQRKLAETRFGSPIAVRKYSQAQGSGRRAELSAIGKTLAEIAEIPTTSPARVSCRSSETSETSDIETSETSQTSETSRRRRQPSAPAARSLSISAGL